MTHLTFRKVPEDFGLDFDMWTSKVEGDTDIFEIGGDCKRECLLAIVEFIVPKDKGGCEDSYYNWLVGLTDDQLENIISCHGYTHNLKEIFG